MSLRTTLILLTICMVLGAIILGIERYLPSTRELAEMRSGPLHFEAADLKKIHIQADGGEAFTLEWDGAQWWVQQPTRDLADPERLEKLVQELQAIGWLQKVHEDEFEDATAWQKTRLDKPLYKIILETAQGPQATVELGALTPIEGSHYLALQTAENGTSKSLYVAKTTLPDLLKATTSDWRDPRLLRLPEEVITNLKLTHAKGQIELNRSDDKTPWMLVKPLSARASKERVSELISSLLNLTIKEATEAPLGTASPQTDAAASNLDAQSLKITVAVKGFPKPFELTLQSPKSPDAQSTTARASYRKPLYTIVCPTLSQLWTEPNPLRDRMLARIDKQMVSQIDITSALHTPIHLKTEKGSWYIQRQKGLFPANGDRIFRFFEALNTFEVHEFTSDTASNLTPYGLDKPFLTVSWVEAGSTPVKLHLGANEASTDFFARYDSEPSVYRIDATLLPSIPQEAIKWKGLGILRFTQFALRQISLSMQMAPPILLDYDPTTAQWTGSRAGQDITAQIDRVKADKLAVNLAKLNAQDWVADTTNAIHALQKPALRIEVTLGEPGTNTGTTRKMIVNFSPTQEENMNSALFYGQLEGDGDIFYISRTSLLELLAPVFKSEG